MNSTALKLTGTTLRGLLLPYGGPFAAPGAPDGVDLDAEWFSENTNFGWGLDAPSLPLLYNHGTDKSAGIVPVGAITTLEPAEDGIWMTAQLDKVGQYFASLKRLVAKGALHLSAGAMAHLCRTDPVTGEVLQFPVVEGSLTPHPCNPRATVSLAEAKAHFAAAGANFAPVQRALKALAEGDDSAGGFATASDTSRGHPEGTRAKGPMTAAERDALPDSAFAFIDDEGERHLPLPDAEHVHAALGRFSQTDFGGDTAAKQRAWRKILAAARKFGVEVSTTAMPDGGKALTLDADAVVEAAQALTSHARALAGRRVKEGRILSASNRAAIAESISVLQELLDSTEVPMRPDVKALVDEAETLSWFVSTLPSESELLQREVDALGRFVDSLPPERGPKPWESRVWTGY